MSDQPTPIKFSNLNLTMKSILTFLCILGVVVPAVLGFVNLDTRIDTAEAGLGTHLEHYEKTVDKLQTKTECNKDSIHALQLVDKGLSVQYAEILRRLDELKESK